LNNEEWIEDESIEKVYKPQKVRNYYDDPQVNSRLKSIVKISRAHIIESPQESPTKSKKTACPICSKILVLSSLANHIKAHEGMDMKNLCANFVQENVRVMPS
jgi:hypothetical protein